MTDRLGYDRHDLAGKTRNGKRSKTVATDVGPVEINVPRDHVKIRDRQVANRPAYMALAVTAEGHRDILGLWGGGEGGEGAKHCLRFLTELKNRGVEDVLMLVCDGLKGLPDAVGKLWPRTVVQTFVVHLLRASFRHAGRQGWNKIAKTLKPAPPPQTRRCAPPAGSSGATRMGTQIPGDRPVVGKRLAEFVPLLLFDAEIRRIACTTNAIEPVNARIRRAVGPAAISPPRTPP
ncbi:transposase [Streptomyces goshikiensis]|uniref:transposase n=1 Tax=Streptomyces goshikiensis TaxID=1942 RepID=UPI00331E2BAF